MTKKYFSDFKKFTFINKDNKNLYVRKLIFLSYFALIGFVYQFITLSLMLSNDILHQDDIKLWNGYYPWWSVFFTFTFWSNFILLITYLIYTFIAVSQSLRKNNVLVLVGCTYITLVFVVVAFFFFPFSLTLKNNVDFTPKTSTLTYAALIMPHAPGPILFIVYSFCLFGLNKQGNKPIKTIGFWKLLLIASAFFICYMCMDIILNWIPTGAYYFITNSNGHLQKVMFKGYTVYSWFTAINPELPIINGGKISGYGSPLYLLWYLLGVVLFLLIYITIYFIITNHLLALTEVKVNEIRNIKVIKLTC